MAEVIPFPLTRRRAFIAKQAGHAAEMHPDAATRYVQHQVKVQRDTMLRKGVAEEVIEHELRCMELAIRTSMITRQNIQPGGVS